MPTQPPTLTVAPTFAPEASRTPSPVPSPDPGDYRNASRRETVIFEIAGGRVASPDQWNPYLPGCRRDQGFHQALIEPFFILNPLTGKMEPWLAESMTANASLDEWILKLRNGITWNDGKPMDAEDVIFTINLIREYAAFGDRDFARNIRSVSKIDDQTVKFTLMNPNPRFQQSYFTATNQSAFIVLPRHIWEGKNPLSFNNYDPDTGLPVFSGPYKLASASPVEFTYVRDDRWWGAKTGFKPLPQPKKLVWVWLETEPVRVERMATRNLDSLPSISLAGFQAIKSRNPNVSAWSDKLPYAAPDPCVITLDFNTTRPPWNDKTMRWALNKLIDREKIITVAFQGTTFAARSLFPAYPPLNRLIRQMQGRAVYDEIWRQDRKEAEATFIAYGYSLWDGYYTRGGKQLTLTIETLEDSVESRRIGDLLVEMFQVAGVQATQKILSLAAWKENFAAGRFEARLGWQACGSINEPWTTLDTLSARWLKPVGEWAGSNGWRWNDPIYTRLVAQLGALPLESPQADNLALKALAIYYEELPAIPLVQDRKLFLIDNTYWVNWPSATNNYVAGMPSWQTALSLITSLKSSGVR